MVATKMQARIAEELSQRLLQLQREAQEAKVRFLALPAASS